MIQKMIEELTAENDSASNRTIIPFYNEKKNEKIAKKKKKTLDN
jgi:hypothetical protein